MEVFLLLEVSSNIKRQKHWNEVADIGHTPSLYLSNHIYVHITSTFYSMHNKTRMIFTDMELKLLNKFSSLTILSENPQKNAHSTCQANH